MVQLKEERSRFIFQTRVAKDLDPI